MTVNRALVLDDRTGRVEGWKEVLGRRGSAWEVVGLTAGDLAQFVTELGEHEQRVRQGLAPELQGDHAKLANACDLVLIDADLSPARQDLEGVPRENIDDVVSKLRNQSGDTIARQVRSYTTANAVVVANMFHPRHRNGRVFDLTLMQQAGTHADGHISAAELDDDALWDWDPERPRRFDPWYRDLMPELTDAVRRSVGALEGRLDEPVLAALGMDPDHLAARQLDLFGAKDPRDATFLDLATGPLGLPYPEAPCADRAAAARMAASLVRRWLTRVVLPAQNVIVDAPHLIARFPKLGRGSDGSSFDWNQTTNKHSGAEPLPEASDARATLIDEFLTRPVYFAEAAREIQRHLAAGGTSEEDLVFAEDTSRFIPREGAEEFTSDVPGSYATRWIENLEGTQGERDEISYEPFTRLL